MEYPGWDNPYDQPQAPSDTPEPPPDPNAITRDKALELYYAWTGRTPDQVSEEEIRGAMGHPGGLSALSTFMANSPEGKAYTARNRNPQAPPAPPAPPSNGGGGTTQSPPPTGYPSADFTPTAPTWDFGAWQRDRPTFNAPVYDKPPAFVEPDYAAALNDPGYKFEDEQGRKAVEQSAAARGVLNGGGTLKDILQWGSNYATTRVNDVRNRAKDTYQLNYQTQYTDPYRYMYQSALDAFTGNLNSWQTQGQVGQRQGEADWLHQYTPFNDAWNRRINVALA